jgi:hypothetical protein
LLTSQLAKGYVIKGLGEDIDKLFIHLIMLEDNVTIGNMISDEVVMNVYVFGSGILDGIMGNLDSTFIVT